MGKIKAKTIIFASKMDIASRNIKNQILKNHEFKEDELEGQKIYHNVEKQVMLVEILEDSIYAENIEGKFEAELFIFATRHSAESRIPALLTHVPGNWTENTSMGGKPRSVAIAPPTTLKIALMELEKQARENRLDEYKIGLEVTHHGPYIEKTPTIFMELGSSKDNWMDEKAAYVVSEAIMKVVEYRLKSSSSKYKIGIGLGGPHYAPVFTRRSLETEYAIGHIIPEYVYDEITRKEIDMAINRNEERVEYVLLEWKGLKRHHRELTIKYLEEIGQKWIKV